MRPRHVLRQKQRGTSLIEVLVAFVVLSAGILGMVALQAKALRNNQNSLERTEAVVLSYSIIDRLRANRTQALAGSFNIPSCPASGGGSGIGGVEKTAWLAEVATALGNDACGTVSCAGNVCTVTLRWSTARVNESYGSSGAGAFADDQQFQTVVRL